MLLKSKQGHSINNNYSIDYFMGDKDYGFKYFLERDRVCNCLAEACYLKPISCVTDDTKNIVESIYSNKSDVSLPDGTLGNKLKIKGEPNGVVVDLGVSYKGNMISKSIVIRFISILFRLKPPDHYHYTIDKELRFLDEWKEQNRCFWIHLGLGYGVHPFLLQTYYRSVSNSLTQGNEQSSPKIVKSVDNQVLACLHIFGQQVDINTLLHYPPSEFDGLQV